jgi:hypothetical protein
MTEMTINTNYPTNDLWASVFTQGFLVRPFSSKVFFLIRPDFRSTEIVKF